MDAERYIRHPEAENFWHVSQKSGDLDQKSRDGEGWKLVSVRLSGGAPWGFTLRGGLEHREPLLITKVEEGSKAAGVSLQVGDELVNINEIPLSGFKQEAICLVKGSHKTLSLVVKRRNEPISRPHSWHSTKFNESQLEAGRRPSPPTAVWHTTYDASSSASDLSTDWEQTNLRRVSDQFSSLGSMDSLEHVSHPDPAGQLSPAKSNNSMEHLGGGKRDSAYSSFSTSSSTPDYTLSKSNAASTENVSHKVGQWDPGSRYNSSRNSHSLAAEGVKQDDRPTYFQVPGVHSGHNGPQTEDSAGCRHSTSSRTSFAPVWYVPEKKRSASSTSPPPLPPARSDSFAATKAHERGLVLAHPEAPHSHSASKASTENRHISPKHDSEKVYSSNKTYPNSNVDVSHASQPFQQRLHSDKSTCPPPLWAPSAPKPHYCSSQEVPANSSSNQNQGRSLGLSSSTTDQNTESSVPNRYYCVTTCQPTHPSCPSLSNIPEDGRSGTGVDLPQTGHEQSPSNLQTSTKVKYHLPQQQQHSLQNKDSSAHSKHQVTTVPETSVVKPSSDNRAGHRGHSTQTAESQHISNPPKRQPEQRRSLPAQFREMPQDPRNHNQMGSKICPQATPMLHTLSMDVTGHEEKTGSENSEESLEGKQVNRGNRFATTLRNEIQMRRAKLQKSKSAATLPDVEHEAEEKVWKSTESSTSTYAHGSFSYTYKDNLKEAQARVLRATSFRRKDLEPVLLELSGVDPQPNYLPSTQTWKDGHPLPIVTELASSLSVLSSGQITRVGGRKRFPPEKKVQSFSEPDIIHRVGVNEDLSLSESVSSSLDEEKLIKESGKPEFPTHIPPQSLYKHQSKYASSNVTEDTVERVNDREKTESAPYAPQSVQDNQRLGTFAEYEARWNIQKKPSEKKASGRYLSADNILDTGPEDRIKSACVHERSRSSPSADFYGQNSPVPAAKFDPEYSQMESKCAELLSADTRFPDSRSGDCEVGEKPVEAETYPAPPPPPMPGAAAATMNHKPTSTSHSQTEPAPSHSDGHRHTELSSGPRKKPSALEKPPPTTCQEVNSHQPSTKSQSDIFTHCSANFETSSTFYSRYSAKRDCEQDKGLMDKGQEAVHHLSTSQHPPSPPASSCRPSGLFKMEGQRSPSPQFVPQRLSDKPPVSLHDEEPNRMEHKIENQNTTARKVPIRIVHSDKNVEKENSPFLQQSDLPLMEAEGPGVASLGQDSLFCAFTRQSEQVSQQDSYMTTVGEDCSSNSQQPRLQASDQLSSTQETARLREDEEQKREELVRDITGKDKSLADILDESKMKTTMDLMEGLFPQGEQLLEEAHQRRKVPTKPANSRPVEEREKEDSVAATVSMVTSSTYYSISAPKAELLIKMKDMQEQIEEEDSEEELDIDLANKKQELIDSLSKKLQVLKEARESLQEDVLDNNALGDEVEVQVQQVCKPNELEKFRMFVGDLDKVVSLLLSLSGRLARVENALNSPEDDTTPEERRTLMEKRKLLIRQHEDAKELKANLDRRERVVYDILTSYLPEDSLTDYEHFVKMKSALIIEQRKLEDKIKLGEEQLKCLTDSLPVDQRLVL
ncbi:protein Shroom2 isoform X3 [Nothobranchius furzeri]|uniref:Shroom family member 2 n=1 Tax=Nothobranchius furzeri TaxID=105023 RepID=A0A1A8ADK8_NOTFU|nr:transcript variant X1 [Nothobranchius furzeri]